MSGHEDESLLATFDMANGGIDHSEYKQTDDYYEQPLHFDSTNNFQDQGSTHRQDNNYGNATTNRNGPFFIKDSERHSQVKKPTSRLNSKTNKQPSILQQAAERACINENQFINDLLNGDLPDFNPTEVNASLDALINSHIFQDNFGSTVDFDQSNKGSKFKNFDEDDNQDIHGGETSNACDDDIHGINSPGSSQNSGIYDKPCSSTASPAAPTQADTMVVQPKSPPLLRDATIQSTSKFTELEVFDPTANPPVDRYNDQGINHEELEYRDHVDNSPPTEIIPRTTYPSGIAVGPVSQQVILPSPVAQIPLPQTTVLQDPLHASNHYSVDKVQLSNFLKENGRQVSGRKRKSKEEIDRLVKRFCDPKELDYCTESDAQDIIDSDFEVKNVPLRNRADFGKYLCKFCPLTQNHKRGFDRKEDMKRHYHQHLNYVRFSCKHCEYKNARTDHMKNHMKKCHPEKDSTDYNRNS